MRKNSTTSMGAFHPAVFLLLVYVISLFMSLFVCRMVYYTVNNDGPDFPSQVPSQMLQATALK